MGWFTAIVLYVLVWWVILFTVLPLGVENEAEADPLTGWRGAPARPRIGRKLLLTTLISLAVWGAIVAVIESPFLNFRSGWLAIPEDK